MSGILVILVATLLFFLYFDEKFVPSFPLKYANIEKKSTDLNVIETNVVSVKTQVDDWKEKIRLFKEASENEVPTESPYTDVIIKKMPDVVDYASSLLFIEEQALLHDVIVSDINLNREIDKPVEETTEPTTEGSSSPAPAPEQTTEPVTEPATEVSTQPAHQNNLAQYGVSQQIIDFNIMGDYLKIEEFVQSLSNDMGDYNFIDSLELVRGKSEVIDWEKFKNEVQIVVPNENTGPDGPVEETTEPMSNKDAKKTNINKNIIVKIKMVINYKSGGVN